MRRSCQIFFTLLGCLFAAGQMSVFAQVQDGSSCENAIHVDQNYAGYIPGAGTYWYRAWTYDLPLKVRYVPNTPITQAPKAYVDFTCEFDNYPNNQLQQLFGLTDSLGHPHSGYVNMPFELEFYLDDEGAYTLSVPETYRSIMFRGGLTTDVEAFIRIEAPVGASVGMAPTEEFRNCVGDAEWLKLKDTLHLSATPEEGEFWVFPIELWRNDSLTFKWSGTTDATLTLHYTCDIDPEELGTTMLSEYIDIPAGGEYRMSKAEIDELYATYNLFADPKTSPIGGLPPGSMEGVFYAYVKRTSAGDFVACKTVPEQKGGALQLKIDETVSADSTQLYCFPTSWSTQDVLFATATANIFRMVVATAPFEDASEPQVLATYQFDKTDEGHIQKFTQDDLDALVDQATSSFLYVRFYCVNPTAEVTPSLWTPSDCEISTIPLISGESFRVTSTNKSQVYRIKVSDWCNDSLVVTFSGVNTMPIVVAEICNPTSWSANNKKEVIDYKSATSSKGLKLSAADMASWIERADAEGYVYLRMSPNGSVNITFTSKRVPEEEPEYCKETEWKPVTKVYQYCDTLLPYTWKVYEEHEVMIAEEGTHYDTISNYLSDGTRCDSVIYTLMLSTIHCERPAPEPPGTGGGEGNEGEEGDGEEEKGEGETGGSGEGSSTGGGGETGGNQNTPNPPTPGPGFPEPNYPTGSVIYRGAQTISATCTADGVQEIRVTKAQELELCQGSVVLERWTQQPGEVHRLTLREGVTYTLRGLETLYLRR